MSMSWSESALTLPAICTKPQSPSVYAHLRVWGFTSFRPDLSLLRHGAERGDNCGRWGGIFAQHSCNTEKQSLKLDAELCSHAWSKYFS